MNYCINILLYILYAYYYVMMAGVLLTWVPFLYKFKIFRLIAIMSNWYLGPFKGVLVLGPIDFTPLAGFFLFDGIIKLVYYLLTWVI